MADDNAAIGSGRTLEPARTLGDTARDDPAAAAPSVCAEERRAARSSPARIGVIADAHGSLDPRVKRIFAAVDHIVVAGDVVDPAILSTLRYLAPVTAVRGPSDGGALAETLAEEASGVVAGISFAVGHSSDRLLKRLTAGDIPMAPRDSMPDLVIWAGTHKPAVDFIGGSLFLNPGTATSPDPEDNDPTVALVEGRAGSLTVRFVSLRRRPMQKPRTRKALGFRGGLIPTMIERDIHPRRRKRDEK